MAKFIVRRDPFWQELLDFRQSFDDIVGRFFVPPEASDGLGRWTPAIEAFVDQGKYRIRVALPGIDPKQVSVKLHGNELTVAGEHRQEEQRDQNSYLHREFVYGRFERVLTLPEAVQADKLDATYANGVLELVAPLSEKVLPRTIEVKSISEGSGESKKAKIAAA